MNKAKTLKPPSNIPRPPVIPKKKTGEEEKGDNTPPPPSLQDISSALKTLKKATGPSKGSDTLEKKINFRMNLKPTNKPIEDRITSPVVDPFTKNLEKAITNIKQIKSEVDDTIKEVIRDNSEWENVDKEEMSRVETEMLMEALAEKEEKDRKKKEEEEYRVKTLQRQQEEANKKKEDDERIAKMTRKERSIYNLDKNLDNLIIERTTDDARKFFADIAKKQRSYMDPNKKEKKEDEDW